MTETCLLPRGMFLTNKLKDDASKRDTLTHTSAHTHGAWFFKHTFKNARRSTEDQNMTKVNVL